MRPLTLSKGGRRKTLTLILEEISSLEVIKLGIDGSARKPALIQDTGYMDEKTYPDIAPYLGVFGAYLMPQ